MMINLYGIKNCDSCRKAKRWLQNRDIKFRFTDIREEVLNETLLKKWQKQLDWETLLNKKSMTWRKIPEMERADMDARLARNMILNYPTVMKRPVLDLDQQVVLGFNEDTYEALNL
jgi:Spx/MgsR family transcriptional regulator